MHDVLHILECIPGTWTCKTDAYRQENKTVMAFQSGDVSINSHATRNKESCDQKYESCDE